MHPTRQKLHAFEPGRDVLVLGGDVEAELMIAYVGVSARQRERSTAGLVAFEAAAGE
jgi:hypothetical protein